MIGRMSCGFVKNVMRRGGALVQGYRCCSHVGLQAKKRRGMLIHCRSLLSTTSNHFNDLGSVTRHDEQSVFISMNQYQITEELRSSKQTKALQHCERFDEFTHLLSMIISSRMYGVWEEVKHLYSTINPDTDSETVSTSSTPYSKRKGADRNESFFATENDANRFLLLLDSIVTRAHFSPLSDGNLNRELQEKIVLEGVKVSIDRTKFKFIKIWTRGVVEERTQTWQRKARTLIQKLRGLQVDEIVRVFQRCLVVYGTHDGMVHVKLFKDAEEDKLELLLPHIQMEMSQFDRYLLYLSIAGVTLTSGYRLLTNNTFDVSWMTKSFTAFLFVSGLGVLRYWDGTRNSRNEYLARHNQTLYSNNISTNRSALAVVIDRATEEEYAGALLAYYFLATTSGSLSRQGLSILISDWLLTRFRMNVKFNVDAPLALLGELNLIEKQYFDMNLKAQVIRVKPLSDAISTLQSTSSGDLLKMRNVYIEKMIETTSAKHAAAKEKIKRRTPAQWRV
eukprot:m.111600 g.111600  ORF g.111600 m.111600 type:complete len:507 (-) comp9239_c0_seq1:1381-2901(-)